MAGSHQLVIFDEPFTSLDHQQKVTLATLINQQKRNKAVIVSLNTKEELELLGPTQYRTLDQGGVLTEQPYIRLKFKLKPQSD